VDQHLNNRQNEILWSLLANPADNGHLYTNNLQLLVADFPQSGLLHALLAHSDREQNLTHAAAYFDSRALHSLINASDSLAVVTNEQIIQQLNDSVDYPAADENELLQQQEDSGLNNFSNDADEHLSVEPEIDIVEDEQNSVASEAANITEFDIEDTVYTESEEVIELPAEAVIEPPIIEYSEDIELPVSAEENGLPFEHTEPQKDIDDDVYDEIVGIEDISFAPISKSTHETVLPEESTSEEVSNRDVLETANKDRALNLDDEAEKLIVGNIAATDYFMFDRAVGDRKQPEATENETSADSENEIADRETEVNAENQEVSKYHDDKMPYTFMWWLDRTRKEHAGIYQPFKLDTSQAIRQNGADELQQQYYENIFHLNSVEELDRSTQQQTIEFDMKRKEDRIIKRFISEEPHISTPSSDKLDNENKAKKSAEDQDELVTETLAQIYSDQMLYHKAINTYKKLMLKFPEKSRYFADQIEQLERKTN
jgi:hypothetical protein